MSTPDKLSSNNRNRLKRILISHGGIDSRHQRFDFLENSNLTDLEAELPFEEAKGVFAGTLIREAQGRGIIADEGKHAFVLLLDYLKERVEGFPEECAFIESLYPKSEPLTVTVVSFQLPLEEVPVPAELPSPSHLPFNRNLDFVGREAEMLSIAQAFATIGIKIVAAVGIGGVGKTQLAIEWAHRYGQFFPGGVFWVDFQDPTAIATSIAAAGVAYNFPAYHDLTVAEQSNRVREQWNDTIPKLLVFDNCEDPALLKEYAPTSGQCRILVTSQATIWKDIFRYQGAEQITIQRLERRVSVQLLKQFRPNINEKVGSEIAAELDDLPLALHIAGSFLAQYRATTLGDPQNYLDNLRSRNPIKELSEQSKRLVIELPTKHEQDVARTFLVSMERLGQNWEADTNLSKFLLLLLATFAPGVATPAKWLEKALPEGINELDAADAIKRLADIGLGETPKAGQLRLHRLVAFVVVQNVTEIALSNAIHQGERIIIDTQPQLGKSNFLEDMEHWLPHARHITTRALPRGDEQAATLANSIGQGLMKLALFGEAFTFLQEGLEIRQSVLGGEHPDTAKNLHNLAEIYREQGSYSKALPLYEQALTVQEITLGGLHADTATTVHSIARIRQTLGDYSRALDLFEQALAIRKETLGENHPDTASSLNNIGDVHRALGDYSRALDLYEQALRIRKETLGENHPDTATSLNNIGRIHRDLGDYSRALGLYEQTLAIKKETLGENHPDTATSLNNIGDVHRDLGDYSRALDLYEQTLAIRKETFGENHPDTATSLNNIGAVHQELGDYSRALDLFEQALAIQKETLGENHPDTARSLNNIGRVHRDLGDYSRALDLYEQALTIKKETLGENHPDTATSLNNIGGVHQELGDYSRALDLYEQTLAIKKETLGENHPDTATSLNNIGGVHQDLGDYPRALDLFEQALAIQKETLGENHPDTARSFNNIGAVYAAQAKYSDAVISYGQSLRILRATLGNTHPNVAKTSANIAGVYISQQKFVQAKKLLIESLTIYKRVFGRSHKETKEIEKMLRICERASTVTRIMNIRKR